MSKYKLSVEIEPLNDEGILMVFTSNCGKFGTDETVDVIETTPEYLLKIFQREDEEAEQIINGIKKMLVAANAITLENATAIETALDTAILQDIIEYGKSKH